MQDKRDKNIIVTVYELRTSDIYLHILADQGHLSKGLFRATIDPSRESLINLLRIEADILLKAYQQI